MVGWTIIRINHEWSYAIITRGWPGVVVEVRAVQAVLIRVDHVELWLVLSSQAHVRVFKLGCHMSHVTASSSDRHGHGLPSPSLCCILSYISLYAWDRDGDFLMMMKGWSGRRRIPGNCPRWEVTSDGNTQDDIQRNAAASDIQAFFDISESGLQLLAVNWTLFKPLQIHKLLPLCLVSQQRYLRELEPANYCPIPWTIVSI
jgi:hypothetical protein